jgi:hypothetical protein
MDEEDVGTVVLCPTLEERVFIFVEAELAVLDIHIRMLGSIVGEDFKEGV